MSNNNNNNNKDDKDNKDKNNKITLIPKEIDDISLNKFFLPPIDNSKNKIFKTWKINPILNHNLLLLDTCKEKKLNLSKSSKELINKKKLNTNEEDTYNMTINKVIDNIKQRREKNNKEKFNKYRNFIKELDEKAKRDKMLLLEDKKKEEERSGDLKSILDLLNKKVGEIERTNSLFGSKDDSTLFPIGRHRRRSSIYIPSTRLNTPKNQLK